MTACGADVRLNCARDPPKPNRREQEIMTDKNLLGKQVRSDCPSILCPLVGGRDDGSRCCVFGVQELTCVVSYKPVTGQYYDNPEGPVLPDFAEQYARKLAD